MIKKKKTIEVDIKVSVVKNTLLFDSKSFLRIKTATIQSKETLCGNEGTSHRKVLCPSLLSTISEDVLASQ